MTIGTEWDQSEWKLTVKVGEQETNMDTGELILKPGECLTLNHDQWIAVVSQVLGALKGKQDPDSSEYILGPANMSAEETAGALGEILKSRVEWRSY